MAEEFHGCYDAALTAERLAVCGRLDRISLDPADWRTKDRAKLDPLTLYLQRMCAKNDSTGHVGPFTVGTFDPDTDGLHWTEVPLRHHTFLSRWTALCWCAS